VLLQHKLGYLPTISETGDFSPEAGIFSFGLSISGFILAVIVSLVWLLHAHFIYMIEEMTFDQESLIRELKFQNVMNSFYGYLTALCFVATATFRSLEVPIVHYVAAGILFVSSWSFMISSAMLAGNIREFLPEKISHANLKFKWGMVLSASLSLLGLAANFIVYQKTQDIFWWHVFAICEYTLLSSCTAFCFSYWGNFAKYELALKLMHEHGEPSVVRLAPSTSTSPLLPVELHDMEGARQIENDAEFNHAIVFLPPPL